jgi:hypothetical protein
MTVHELSSTTDAAVWGENTNGGPGVLGTSADGIGVAGGSTNSIAVMARSSAADAVLGRSATGNGVRGQSGDGSGVVGASRNNDGDPPSSIRRAWPAELGQYGRALELELASREPAGRGD